MKQKFVVFYPDGIVTVEEHEGSKNKWPVGTMTSFLWGGMNIGEPRKKLTSCSWMSMSYSDITDVHKAMMLLLGIPMPTPRVPYDLN